jgi:hypothetical protein
VRSGELETFQRISQKASDFISSNASFLLDAQLKQCVTESCSTRRFSRATASAPW